MQLKQSPGGAVEVPGGLPKGFGENELWEVQGFVAQR